jgi:hypothetical protein
MNSVSYCTFYLLLYSICIHVSFGLVYKNKDDLSEEQLKKRQQRAKQRREQAVKKHEKDKVENFLWKHYARNFIFNIV